MNPDYEGLVNYMKSLNAVPLIVVYGVEKDGGVDLNFFWTDAYEGADVQLKADTKEAVRKAGEQL